MSDDPIDLTGTGLGGKEAEALRKYCQVLYEAPALQTASIMLYGSAARGQYVSGLSDINLLVIAGDVSIESLKKVLNPGFMIRRYGITPFFLTEEELMTSSDVFPVKFQSIKESYRVLWGEDVLSRLEISKEYMRLRCEQEIKNILLRLRRHYVVGGGEDLSGILWQIVPGFLEALRAIVFHKTGKWVARDNMVSATAAELGLNQKILDQLIVLRKQTDEVSTQEINTLYGQFVDEVSKVAHIADRME